MTDPNKPRPTDNDAEATPVEPDTTETDSTGETDSTESGPTTTPRGKSARRGAAVSTTKESAPSDGAGTGGSSSATTGKDRSGGFAITITGRGIARTVLGLVAVALVALLVFFGWRWYDLDREATAFADAKTASAEFVTKLVTTLNAENAGNSKELLGPLSTGELRERLEQERTDTETNVESLNIEVSSTINVVAVETVDTETAKTVVMAEVTGRSAKLPTGGTSLMVFRLDLNKVDGKWLVSKVDGPPGSPSGQIDPSQSLPGSGGQAPQPGAPAPQQPAPAPAG